MLQGGFVVQERAFVSYLVSVQGSTLLIVGAPTIGSPDALALVRFGLRAPDDPRILNTLKVIDATLKTETAAGPVWHRYTQDGYGEHEDGSPFEQTGIGRGWPLLAGERAHYELAAGNRQEAERLVGILAAQTSPGGMLPEQVCDAPDIPEKELFNGRPSGSAMPLVWAHSEFVKLARSLHDGQIFDLPTQTKQRYLAGKRETPFAFWFSAGFDGFAEHSPDASAAFLNISFAEWR